MPKAFEFEKKNEFEKKFENILFFLRCKCLPLNYCNFGQCRSARVSLCEAESLSPLVIMKHPF